MVHEVVARVASQLAMRSGSLSSSMPSSIALRRSMSMCGLVAAQRPRISRLGYEGYRLARRTELLSD